MRPLQLCMFAILVVALTATAVAQDAPSFLIEKIEVRGARFASATVVARETLLVEGHTYNEPQLREAMSRINRLPFVLDSSFALEKGSDRGAYVLVVTIVETKPLFVEAQSLFESSSGQSDPSNEESIRSGARWFIGSSSLVHASTDFEENYEAGITQYNLFGRPGYVTLNVRWTGNQGTSSFTDPGGQTNRISVDLEPSPELRFGFPIRGNHSVQGQWVYNDVSFQIDSGQDTESSSQKGHSAGLAWVWDTTDDPVLPTSGSLLRSGVDFSLWTADAHSTLDGFPFVSGDSQQATFSTRFNQYRPINDSVSVMYGAHAGVYRISTDPDRPQPIEIPAFTTWVGGPEIGFSTSLWPDRLTRKFGDLRWETRASYSFTGGDRYLYPVNYGTASTAIVQRNVWGTLRLGFTYQHWDQPESD